MPVTVFHRLCLIFMQTCSIGSIIVNAMLIPLIHYRSGRGIGKYRHLLMAYVLVTMAFAFISATTVPVFSPTNQGWIMYASINLFPQEYGSWMSVLFCMCYSLQLVVICLSFIYRALVVCNREKLYWFYKKEKLSVLLGLAMAVNLTWTGMTALFLRPNEKMNGIFEERVRSLSDLDIRQVAYIAGVAYLDNEINWEFAMVFSCRIIICILSSTVIVYCVVKTLSRFLDNTKMVSTQEAMSIVQKKLFYLLLFQTLIPLFLAFLPAICGYGFAFLRISSPSLTTLFSTMLPLAQLADPLIILLFIADYRRSLVTFVLRLSKVTPSNGTNEAIFAVNNPIEAEQKILS